MSLALEKSYIVQQDLITVGSIVFIRGGSIEYRVKAIHKDRKTAWLANDGEYFSWPVSDLVFESQLDLFPQYPIFRKCDKNCHKNGFAGLAVLVTPPLSLTGETLGIEYVA
ncbi:hypothetical protein OAE19_00415 [Porticoccaceae bacterium]|nr:hypothetical protein [Porticoccaceae bacterium]